MKKMIEIFKNKTFSKVFFANFTSQMGSTVGMTAFMFYLLDRFDEQPIFATITELMYSLPTLAVFFLVGVFADRMDRQKIAYHCDWISAVLSMVLIVVILVGWMPLIFAVLFMRSAVQKFFFPAEGAIVQGILAKDDYTTAAGLNQMVNSLFMLFGSGIGIFAYWTLGIYGAIVIDTITFIISAFLIRTAKIPEEVRLPNGSHKLKDLKVKLVLKDFMIGMKYILNHKLLLSLIIGFFVFGVVNGGFSVMPAFILKYKLAPETYEEWSVVLGIIFGMGVLIGSVAASAISQKVKLHHLIITGLLISGTFVCLASLTNSTWIFMALIFVSALGLPLVNIGIGGWMPSIVDPKMMGRVQGWISPLMMLSQSVTLGFIAFSFPSLLSIEMIFWIVGGCLFLVGVYYMFVLPKYAKSSDSNNVKITTTEQVGTL